MVVVSGTAIDAVMAMRLHYGDILGNVRRSLNNFPVKEIGQQMIDKFYNTNNKIKQMFKFTMPSLNMSQEKEYEHHYQNAHCAPFCLTLCRMANRYPLSPLQSR